MNKILTHLHTAHAYTAAECLEVIEEFDGFLHDATVRFENAVADHSIRKTGVVAIPTEHWLTDALMSFCDLVNIKAWQFHIDRYDILQFAEYTEGGHYDWHMDIDPLLEDDQGCQRKVTAVLMLSDPEEYEGGELQLQTENLGKLGRGDVVVFPSFLQHRVTPVTAGKRYTAVIWAKGPRFK